MCVQYDHAVRAHRGCQPGTIGGHSSFGSAGSNQSHEQVIPPRGTAALRNAVALGVHHVRGVHHRGRRIGHRPGDVRDRRPPARRREHLQTGLSWSRRTQLRGASPTHSTRLILFRVGEHLQRCGLGREMRVGESGVELQAIAEEAVGADVSGPNQRNQQRHSTVHPDAGAPEGKR